MATRLAGLVLVLGLFVSPSGAVVMAPGDGLAVVAAVEDDEGLPAWSISIAPAAEAPPGPLAKIFTIPNIAVALAGMVWMSLVRRRLSRA